MAIAAIGAGKVGAAQGQTAGAQKPQGHRAKPSQNFGDLLKHLIDTQAAGQLTQSHKSGGPTQPAAAPAATSGINLRA
jgi:hypothetical protein